MQEKVVIDGKEYDVLTKDDQGYINFVLEMVEKLDHCITVNVYDVESWSSEDRKEPLSINDYLHAFMKWDGCCHVWFGERKMQDEQNIRDSNRDSYLHLCGSECWKIHIKMMEALYKYAEQNIKNFDRISDGWE